MNDQLRQIHQPYRTAGLWVRFLANAIDAVVVSLVVSPFFALISDGGRSAGTAMLFPAVFTLYEFLTVARYGQSVGKRILRVRVVTSEDDLRAPGYRISARRFLVKTGEPLLLLLLLLLDSRVVSNITAGYLFVISLFLLFSKVNRGLHDKVAKTFVVRVERAKRGKKTMQSAKPRASAPVHSAKRKKTKKSKGKKRR